MPSLLARPRLCCLGDLTLDIVVRSSGAAESGTDVAADIQFRAGGSAANTARAFASLGGRAVFVGALGDDDVGGRLRAFMRSAGVTVHAPRVRGRSARLVVSVAPNGERSFLTDRGVADQLSVSMLRPSWLSRVDALHVPLYSLLGSPLAEASLSAASTVHSVDGLVSIDLASRKPLLALGRRASLQLIARASPDVLFANEDEIGVVADSRDQKALAKLAPIVVIKQGASGCRLVWRSPDGSASIGHSTIATRRVSVADTTGAGDAFDAGFLFALLSGGYRRDVRDMKVDAALLRRAALAGHRAAARLLTAPRKELAL